MEKNVDTKTPQQLETEGGDAYRLGNYIEAANIFSAAESGYQSQGETIKSAEMANNCSVAFLLADQPQDALKAVEETVELFREAQDKRRLSMALGNRAAALEAMQRYDPASLDYEQSAKILKEIGENDLRLDVMKSLSALQLRTGRSLEALATMQSGVDAIEKPKVKHRILMNILKWPFRFIGR